MIEPSRRSLLTGLGALIAAPAIVRASSLMPVKAPPLIKGEIGTWNNVLWSEEYARTYMKSREALLLNPPVVVEYEILGKDAYFSLAPGAVNRVSGLVRPLAAPELVAKSRPRG